MLRLILSAVLILGQTPVSRFYAASPFSIPAAAVSVTVDSTTTLVTGTISGKDWHGRASTVTRSDGVILLFWHDSTGHTVNDGALHVKFSDDDGVTWTATDTKIGGGAVTGFPMNPPGLAAGEDAGEPWAIIAPSGDILLFMWKADYTVTAGGTYMSRSTDGGETWSTATGPIAFTGFGATSDTHNRTFATDDGFVYQSSIIMAARIYTSVALTASNMVLVRSDDDGVTWYRVSNTIASTTDVSPNGVIEAGVERVGTTSILTMLRELDATTSWQRSSTDLGVTWGTLTNVGSTVGIAGRQRVYTRAHLKGQDNWWLDPILLMVGYVHQTSGSAFPRRNCVWVSRDHGVTWSTPFYIDTNGASTDGGYGDIFWSPSDSKWVVINYKGTDVNSADIIEYRLTITGV